jgi:DNA invertase Pin-like site-specific DNA recombinase
MNETTKIGPSHLRRPAVIYVRQSSASQVERNTESTARQYGLTSRAAALGWPASAVRVIDDDLGLSGTSAAGRSGFAELAAQVGLGQVGIVLALEVSRLARNNSDWYRLLDLAGMTDTLIADSDGVYHPAMFNDRLLLGMKGAMSEAELHILRARLDGGIRNKAARGELRKALPVGLVWGEAEGEILLHPDEAVRGAITAVFEQFPLCGSARGTWLWLREQGLKLPLQKLAYVHPGEELIWVEPTYNAVHNILTHPVYAGAYVFGKTRHERYVDQAGEVRTRRRVLPPGEWQVLIPGHHQGYIDWESYQANQARIGANTRPRAHQPGTGALREGCALLQGLATCGTCGRKLAVYYDGPAKGNWSTGEAFTTCASVAWPSKKPSPRPSWPPWNRRPCRPAWPRPSNWRDNTTLPWPSSGVRWSAPVTPRPRPSAVTGRSTPRTASSPEASKPRGRLRYKSSSGPKTSWHVGSQPGPRPSAK